MQPKSLAVLKEILIKAVSASWPLLLIPLIHYGQPLLVSWLSAWDAWLIRCWLPAGTCILALILYQQQHEGSTVAAVLASLMAICFGGLFCWLASQKLLLPFWPKHLFHISYFLKHVDWLNMGHATGSLFIGFVLLVRVIQDLVSGDKNQKKTTHGSARLMTLAEIRKVMKPAGLPLGLLPANYQADDPLKTVASIQKQKGGKLLFAETSHTMVIAPSGAGKGVGYVIPTLLEYKGAVFVTDIKGENYAVTAGYRQSLGRQVVAFDPFGITDSTSVMVNPMDMISDSSLQALDQATQLAELLCPTDPHAYDNIQHFTSHAAKLIKCLILYVKCSGEYPKSQQHLSTVYSLLALGDDGLKEKLQILRHQHFTSYGMISQLAATYAGTPEREFSGITNTARRQLDFVSSPAVQEMLSASTFDLRALINGQTDFYLCIPPEQLKTQAFLIRLFASLIFTEITKARGCKGSHNLLMLVDEMPALQYVPQFEDILVYGRGYGVTFMGFAQTLELLQSVYPKTYRTFLSSNTTIFFDATELKTSEYVSSKLGRTTIEQSSVNEGKSKQKSFHNSVSEQESRTTSESARALLTSDEVACLGSDVSLIFMRGQRPLLLKKPRYFTEKRWQGKFNHNPLENKEPTLKGAPQASIESTLEGHVSELDSTNAPIQALTSSVVPYQQPTANDSDTDEATPKEESQPSSPDHTLEGYLHELNIFDVKTKAKYLPLLKLIWNEAGRGRIYTQNSFCMYFSGVQRLGSSASINLHLKEMLMKGIIGLFINGKDYGFENCDDGYLCLEGMPVLLKGVLDEQGNDVFREVYPTHRYDQSTGQIREV